MTLRKIASIARYAGLGMLILELFFPTYIFSTDPDIVLYGYGDPLTYYNLVPIVIAWIISVNVIKTVARPLVIIFGLAALSFIVYGHSFIVSIGSSLSPYAFLVEAGDLLLFFSFFVLAEKEKFILPRKSTTLLDQ